MLHRWKKKLIRKATYFTRSFSFCSIKEALCITCSISKYSLSLMKLGDLFKLFILSLLFGSLLLILLLDTLLLLLLLFINWLLLEDHPVLSLNKIARFQFEFKSITLSLTAKSELVKIIKWIGLKMFQGSLLNFHYVWLIKIINYSLFFCCCWESWK